MTPIQGTCLYLGLTALAALIIWLVLAASHKRDVKRIEEEFRKIRKRR